MAQKRIERKRKPSKAEQMLRKRVYFLQDEKHPVMFAGPDILRDYGGMNWYAAKKMGFKWPKGFPKSGYIVSATSPPDVQFIDLGHEHDEAVLMDKGLDYWTAHCAATDKEVNSRKALRTGKDPILVGKK